MTRRASKLSIAGASALCIMVATLMESVSMEFALAGMALSLVPVVGALICAQLSARTFRGQTSREIMADAFLIALLPVVTISLLAITKAGPNAHGGVILGIILWAPISEITALILMLSVGIRTIRIRNRP